MQYNSSIQDTYNESRYYSSNTKKDNLPTALSKATHIN